MHSGDTAGTSAVAAPILDYRGIAVGAMAIMGLAFRLAEERLHGLAPLLMEAARRLSHDAGGTVMSLSAARADGSATPGVRCAIETKALLGEAPYWSHRDHTLTWVDMLGPSVSRATFAPDMREVPRVDVGPMPRLTSLAVPRRGGGFLHAQPSGLRLVDPERGQDDAFVHPESARPRNRYNDGKCGARGGM